MTRKEINSRDIKIFISISMKPIISKDKLQHRFLRVQWYEASDELLYKETLGLCFRFKKWHILQSEPGPGPKPSQKADPGPLEKVNLMPKFIIMVKKFIFDKLKDADSNYDNSFFKFQSKTTQIRKFWSQISLFCLRLSFSFWQIRRC